MATCILLAAACNYVQYQEPRRNWIVVEGKTSLGCIVSSENEFLMSYVLSPSLLGENVVSEPTDEI